MFVLGQGPSYLFFYAMSVGWATNDNASAVNLTTRVDVRAAVKKKENNDENKIKNSFRILRVLLI